MTYAEKLVKDHVIYQYDRNNNPQRAFILFQNASRIDLENPCSLLLPGITRRYKCDFQTNCVSFEVHIRFVKAIIKAGDNMPRIYILLNQLLTEDAIKKYFYDVWLAHNNVSCRRKNNRERQERHLAFKHGEIRFDPIHHECSKATRNYSIRDAAKLSRVYT